MSTSISTPTPVSRRTTAIGLVILVVVAAIGLGWAKWLPYAQRAGAVAASGSWKSS